MTSPNRISLMIEGQQAEYIKILHGLELGRTREASAPERLDGQTVSERMLEWSLAPPAR
jgi:hypothetical protein